MHNLVQRKSKIYGKKLIEAYISGSVRKILIEPYQIHVIHVYLGLKQKCRMQTVIFNNSGLSHGQILAVNVVIILRCDGDLKWHTFFFYPRNSKFWPKQIK